MTGQPDVSVLIAAWNAEAFIESSVRAALAQANVEVEVIVVDDASTDGTGRRCEALAKADPRIRYERLEQNMGPSGARNRGLDLARGRYIAVLDADDDMNCERLAQLVALIEATEADIVVDNMWACPPAPAAPRPFLALEDMDNPFDITLLDYADPETAIRCGACFGFLKPLFRRSVIEAGQHRYDVTLRNSEDYYFVAYMLASGARMVGTQAAGYRYAVEREGSLSHRLNPTLTEALLRAERRFRERFEKQFSGQERDVLDRRMRALRHQDTFERVVAGLKSRSPKQVAAPLIARPGAMGHVAKRLTEIAAAKISG